jgi:tRNA(Ile)-lysidine synthase
LPLNRPHDVPDDLPHDTPTGAPIGPDEAATLLNGLDRPLAIAVSGGVDSIALLHLVARWRQGGGGAQHPVPQVLTVDHGLRTEAAVEAAFVSEVAQHLGWSHRTLNWTGPKPIAGVQAAAREARYDLLLQALASADQPRDLVLAHTQDDQAETFLMRLARGSGMDGLSAMRPLEHRIVLVPGHPMRDVMLRLMRPLLGIPKGRLIATAVALGAKWCEDPSNSDRRFERVRLRDDTGMLAALGLSAPSLARAARRQALEREAALSRARDLAALHIKDHGGAFGELTLPSTSTLARADLGRLLARMLEVFGGLSPPAQLSQIETLAASMLTRSSSTVVRSTLGGCLIEILDDLQARHIRVFREAGRKALETRLLSPGEGIFWDGRFYISVAHDCPTQVRIGPAGPDFADPDWPKDWPKHWPRACAAGLPALVCAVPAAQPQLLFSRTVPNLHYTWPQRLRDRLYFKDP